ncbi:MAG: hypothetical protein JWP12_3062 [Bacteroidetes bacterium]|nr:hypothetical protein [Bacteroidota bacterium]
MKQIFLAFICLVSLSLKAQQVFLYSDSAHVVKFLSTEPELDTIVLISDKDYNTVPRKVYFDQKKTRLAFEVIIKGDTTITNDYWRSNGKLKRLQTSYKLPNEDFYVADYQEFYCENGQLIRKGHLNNTGTEHIINYYCNGKKKNEFTFIGMYWEGLYTAWYENGQKENEGNYVKTKKDGEWKYWDQSGKLLLIEIYKNGELTESKKQ